MPTPPRLGAVVVHNAELEAAVLSALMKDTPDTDRAMQQLDETCFYQQNHLIIFRAIRQLYCQGAGLSWLAVATLLHTTMQVEQVNGLMARTAEIDELRLNAMGLMPMTRLLVEYARRRSLLLVAQTFEQLATDLTLPLEQSMTEVLRLIDQVMTGPDDHFVSLDTCIDRQLQVVEDNLSDLTRHTGLLTGLPDIDQHGGLPDDGLTVIAAKSGHGKTSMADYLALQAMKAGRRVAFYSMEMSQLKVTARLLAMESQVNSMAIQRFRLCDDDYQRVHRAAAQLKQAHAEAFSFDNHRCRSIDQIEVSARTLKKSQGLDLIIVDYLQMMRDADHAMTENANKLMADIARRLHDLAQDQHLAVIALAQVNRTTQVATMASIRDSGEIAEAADMVLVLRRPYKDHLPYNAPYANVSTQHTMQVSCEKSRDGSTYQFFAGFDEQYTRVYPLDQHQLPQSTLDSPLPDEPTLFSL